MSDGEINVDSIDGEVSTSANIVGELYPKGEKGDKGDPGNDGFSPTVTTEKVGKTTTITITDAEGEHTATILDGADGQGSGDMRTEVYDKDQNGIVDNAEKVNNHTVGTDVPADAVFTDTTYTAGTGIDITGNVITNTQTSAEWGNITGTLSDQTDLKTALDDKADTSDLATVATSGDYSDLLNKPSIPTNTSDLTNNSGFIDKDVNNLTNYDTSTTVDTKISNSEEVLIGSDSGIKASHELWVDTNDVTPYINSEISNTYGTAQNLGYSQEYVNTKLSEKLDATGTAVNSTKWGGTTNDMVTENNVDTWIPVLNSGKLQHTTVSNIGSRINTISTGSGTADYTYINSVENNHWERSGNVVSYAFTIRAKGNWGATTVFMTGLPRAQTDTRFLGLNPDASAVMRFAVLTDGSITNAWSTSTPANEQVIEGHITYITKD